MRYEARPGRTGYSVVDTTTGLCARKGRKPRAGLTLDEAEATAARLNAEAARRKLCKVGRHLAPADEVLNGRCRSCA